MAIPIDRHFKAQVGQRRYKDAISMVRKVLTKRQLKMFQSTCFGHFLDLKDSLVFGGMLVHASFLRAINRMNSRNELWFRLNRVDVRFNPYELAIMINLQFRWLIDVGMYISSNDMRIGQLVMKMLIKFSSGGLGGRTMKIQSSWPYYIIFTMGY